MVLRERSLVHEPALSIAQSFCSAQRSLRCCRKVCLLALVLTVTLNLLSLDCPLCFSLSFARATSFNVMAEAIESRSKRTITNIIFAIAMEAEASPFVSRLKLDERPDFFPKQTPFKAFQGVYQGCNVTVVMNGKDAVYGTGVDNCGTVPAALATFLALQKLEAEGHPANLLVNAGTCGGFKSKGAAIGDTFLTTAVANHDRRIPIPSFTPYGIGRIESVTTTNLAATIGAKSGICTTGNSLDMHEGDDFHIRGNDASVKDMEAAAIAWICSLYHTPHFGVKVVTDIVDGGRPTTEEFLENLHTAAAKLQEALPRVIENVCGKSHEEL